MNYPRYPEYKPSGVEWLGEVPGHWEVKRRDSHRNSGDTILKLTEAGRSQKEGA